MSEFLSIEETKLNKLFRDDVHYNLDGHKFVSDFKQNLRAF